MSFADRLFAVETNLHFPRSAVDASTVRSVVDAFGIKMPYRVLRIGKRNPGSTLYEVEDEASIIMLRASAPDERTILERQCGIVSELPYARILKPIVSSSGEYAIVVEDAAWVAYPKLLGHLFDGSNAGPLDVMSEGLGLLDLLSDIVEPPDSPLRRPSIEIVGWEMTLDQLLSASPVAGVIDSLPPATRQELILRRGELERSLEEAKSIVENLNSHVVHNDLQHANVLVEGARPSFLDIEDVCIGSSRVAAAQCIFKLLRHCVFTNHSRLPEMQALVRKQLDGLLAEHRCWSAEPTLLHTYAVFRIWSDIVLIYRAHLKGNSAYMVDLEKKFLNLFELDLLMGMA